MNKEVLNILVTFDTNYIEPFKTMFTSLIVNNPNERFQIWLLHSAISKENLNYLEEYCNKREVLLSPIQVDRTLFKDAPISKQYPQEMYYRLLAPQLLPETLNKVLYLDPDILILNSVRPLWDIELGDYSFAAASHSGIFGIMNTVNRVRLNTDHDYFNSGVMLMDLKKARKLVKPSEVFTCVNEHEVELLLPDQDVFNYLYGKDTLQVEDEIWNYDARYYKEYLLRSNGSCDLDWIMQNTVVLHFCGKKKPWKSSFPSRFASLYKHYMQMGIREDN
ncbi:glycosyltransferase family 8 protein [Clostridium culturomicium]|uniref:glycosyltransferase family 8 protein n=1 Tax=Clostridium culturomicium TaxID=1499683 RepID=UPI0038572A02